MTNTLNLDAAAIEQNSKLDDMISPGMAVTDSWVSMWSENLRYFFSDQLHGKPKRDNWEWVVVNYIWPSAMAEICKLARHNPHIVAEPWEPSDQESADVWLSNIRWLWSRGINGHGMLLEHLKTLLDKKLWGYSVSKVFWEPRVTWDEKTRQWQGEAKYKLWHPALFWMDPNAETVEEAQSLGTQRYVPLEWAQARWPQHKVNLEKMATKHVDAITGPAGGPHIRAAKTAYVYVSAQGGTDPGTSRSSISSLLSRILSADKMTQSLNLKGDQQFVKIEEIYYRDAEEKTIKEETPVSLQQLIRQGTVVATNGGAVLDALTGEPMTSENWPKDKRQYVQPLYPRGRFVLRAGGELILNKGNQAWPYNQWPYIVSPHYLLPHMWQGSDGVQLYKSNQDMINVSVSHLFNNMKMYGDPKVLMERGAIDRDPRSKKYYEIGAGAGSIIRLVRGALSRNLFKIDQPPAMSPAALQLYALFTQEYKNIMGLQSIAKGEKERGRMSATQAQHLAVSATDRVRLQSMIDDEWIKQVCELIAEIIQANYDEGRMIRIIGDTGVFGAKEITSREKDVRYDLNVMPASMLPFDEDKRLGRHLQAYEILNNPMTNPLLPTLLRELGIPNVRGILKDLPAWQKWLNFLRIYQSIAEGQIEPEQAVKIIVQLMGGLQRPPEKPKTATESKGKSKEGK